jgi:hypothetical protein
VAEIGRPPLFDNCDKTLRKIVTMRRWNPFAFKPAIGLVIDQRQIALSMTVMTLRGRKEVVSEVCDYDEGCAAEVLGRMLLPWAAAPASKRATAGPWVRVGMPAGRVFQATLAITSSNRQQTAQNFFLEAVQATNVRAEDRIVEMTKIELDGRSLACVAASPRSAIESSIDLLTKLGTRVGLIEPTPAALFRAGTHFQKAPRGSKLSVRFFLGDAQAIGILAAGSQPLFWHTFDLTKGDETSAMLAAYSTLWMMGRDARISTAIDSVIIHGRPDLVLAQLEDENCRQRLGAKLVRCSKPSYDLGAAAFGLSLADPFVDFKGLDLARTLKPVVTIRDIFPYAELLAHGTLLGAVSLYLIGVANEANERMRATARELRTITWLAKEDQKKLDAEKKTVQDRLKAVTEFRSSRAAWSALLRTIAVAMPRSTIITSMSGDAEIEAAGGRSGPSRSKKKLVVSFETPVAGNGSLPPEIDAFLTKLRGDATLKRHFPLIEVTGFRSNPTRAGSTPSASFSVVCLPGSEKAKTVARR